MGPLHINFLWPILGSSIGSSDAVTRDAPELSGRLHDSLGTETIGWRASNPGAEN